MPASVLSSVDLPEPLCPISPKVEPRGMDRLMSRSAQNSSYRPLPLTNRSLSESRRSVAILNFFDSSRTSMAMSAGSRASGGSAGRIHQQAGDGLVLGHSSSLRSRPCRLNTQ